MITSTPERPTTVVPAVAMTCVAAAFWACAQIYGGQGQRFPAAPIAFVVFVGIQLTVPKARWNGRLTLGPGNIALLAFALQLVVLPAALAMLGPTPGRLLALPSDGYINAALVLQAVAYICYALSYAAPRNRVRSSSLLPRAHHTVVFATAFLVIGGLGLVMAFPSIGALVEYFSGHGDVSVQSGPSSLSGAAATFLRPFLPYGIIILWAARIARRKPGRPIQPAEFAIALLAIAASATYGYNRGSVAVPILALITAFSLFGRRQSPTRIATLVAVLALAGFGFGQWRSEYIGTQGGTVSEQRAGIDGPGPSFFDTMQVYGNGPQFWAVVLRDVDNSGLRNGKTLAASALLPVPVLGKPFREGSGTTEYNQLVYERSGVDDQILGYGAELYWNFGLAGIIIGYLVLGLAVRRFDEGIRGATDPLAAYSWSYCGTWVALLAINSVSILSQIFVYFFWPIVVMALATLPTSRHSGKVTS